MISGRVVMMLEEKDFGEKFSFKLFLTLVIKMKGLIIDKDS